MTRDDGGNAHRTTSLLQIHISVFVLAGCGEWTDGERLHVTQGGRNFVWQGKPEKVDAFVSTRILKRQNRDCRLLHGTTGRAWGILYPPDEKSGNDCQDNAAY